MLDLRLKFISPGHFVTATKADFDAASAEYKPGQEIIARTSSRRSGRQNSYFHVILQNAHASQQAGPQQPTWEHLKAHVLNAVGHCDVKRFEARAMTREATQAIRAAFHVEFFVDRKTNEIIMKTPRRTRNLGKEEMGALIDKALDYICREIVPGTDPEDLRAMAKGPGKAKQMARAA
jgi:hypothetical protein